MLRGSRRHQPHDGAGERQGQIGAFGERAVTAKARFQQIGRQRMGDRH